MPTAEWPYTVEQADVIGGFHQYLLDGYPFLSGSPELDFLGFSGSVNENDPILVAFHIISSDIPIVGIDIVGWNKFVTSPPNFVLKKLAPPGGSIDFVVNNPYNVQFHLPVPPGNPGTDWVIDNIVKNPDWEPFWDLLFGAYNVSMKVTWGAFDSEGGRYNLISAEPMFGELGNVIWWGLTWEDTLEPDPDPEPEPEPELEPELEPVISSVSLLTGDAPAARVTITPDNCPGNVIIQE